MKMPRFFNTRNKIRICHPLSVLILCIFLIIFLLRLRHDAGYMKVTQVTPLSRPDPQIFCVIMTFAYRHRVAFHIYHTWVNQCDKYLFVSDDIHQVLEPAVFKNMGDKWQRMRAHMDYIYRYHINEGDWFLFANDDNFVMVENLKLMLQSYSSDDLIYFGCKLRSPQGHAYMLPTSSMVLSQSAIIHFVRNGLTNKDICSTENLGDGAYEEFGRCLSNINVIAGDSRDEYQLHRFLPFEPELHLGTDPLNETLKEHKNFIDRSFDKIQDLMLPVSPISISYHLKYTDRLYDFYYFTYRVKNFGLPREQIKIQKIKTNV